MKLQIKALKVSSEKLGNEIDKKRQEGEKLLTDYKTAVAPNVDSVLAELNKNRDTLFRLNKAKVKIDKSIRHLSKI